MSTIIFILKLKALTFNLRFNMNYRKYFQDMTKGELSEFMNNLQSKIDSGRHTGADVQILKVALGIYMERFEKVLI